jgi:hypothetical protein
MINKIKVVVVKEQNVRKSIVDVMVMEKNVINIASVKTAII